MFVYERGFRVRVKYDLLWFCIRIDLGNLEGKRIVLDILGFRNIILFFMGIVYFLIEGS